MNNVEALQKLMKEMVDRAFDNTDMIVGYLGSIAYSLAVISDKLVEKKEGEE